jgi:uncharacterized membrane protein YdjX (TVP38/TMEM64 family)
MVGMDFVKKLKIGAIVIVLVLLTLFVRHLIAQEFQSVGDLQEYMGRFGLAAPLVLMVFQALQVVLPILPGAVGYAAGTVAFGVFKGFLCNYIGISIGSIVAFLLARRYGTGLVKAMFSQEVYDKWSRRIGTRSYGWFLLAVIVLPIFPDDFFCFFSGLMNMSFRKFTLIIILGKPWCILAYSILCGLIK